MKKLFSNLLLTLTMLVYILSFMGCSDDNFVQVTNSTNSLNKDFGFIHNYIVDDLFSNLSNMTTRSNEISIDSLKSLCIDQTVKTVIKLDNSLDSEVTRQEITQFGSASKEVIQQLMTYDDKIAFTEVLRMMSNEAEAEKIDALIKREMWLFQMHITPGMELSALVEIFT